MTSVTVAFSWSLLKPSGGTSAASREPVVWMLRGERSNTYAKRFSWLPSFEDPKHHHHRNGPGGGLRKQLIIGGVSIALPWRKILPIFQADFQYLVLIKINSLSMRKEKQGVRM